ncbi:MAG TPA: type II toxin-antitoxin system VapC family toxin [Mycobacteriales bacterium]|nr:type II toxin-antitoxin system VapC family toxin [Mycobacteriales bacterium]
MIYLDTCAFVKLLWSEPETAALQHFLTERSGQRLVSSELLALEVRRAVLRTAAVGMARADLLLTRVDRVALTGGIVEAASRIPDPHLRSADAIHLATALALGTELASFVTYDKRLVSAAEQNHLPVIIPAD